MEVGWARPERTFIKRCHQNIIWQLGDQFACLQATGRATGRRLHALLGCGAVVYLAPNSAASDEEGVKHKRGLFFRIGNRSRS